MAQCLPSMFKLPLLKLFFFPLRDRVPLFSLDFWNSLCRDWPLTQDLLALASFFSFETGSCVVLMGLSLILLPLSWIRHHTWLQVCLSPENCCTCFPQDYISHHSLSHQEWGGFLLWCLLLVGLEDKIISPIACKREWFSERAVCSGKVSC